MIRKCIIPAAGFGTRFLPATKAQPKEMLPIVDKPVIQYLVEEAVGAGITDIIIITGRGKRSIEDHFDTSFELEKTLVEKGKITELNEVEKISHLANIAYVRQPIPLGDGDALLRAKKWIGNDPCLVLFGDDLIQGPQTGAEQLIKAYEKTRTPIIALEEVPKESVHTYGIIESDTSEGPLYPVVRFLEKPQPHETSSRLGVIGKYIITPEVFEAIEASSLRASDGEIRLADGFASLVQQGHKMYGLKMQGQRYDTGDKFGFLRATIDYALERKDLGPQLREFLQKRLNEK